MLIAIMKDGQLVVGDYRALFPNTSFPANGPNHDWICEQGWPVNLFKPHDRATEKLVPCDPYVEGDWVYTVQVAPLTVDELVAARASAAANLRQRRDQELARSDWRVIKALESNTPQDFEWAAYRQALRDISSAEGFPYVDLPKAPDYVAPLTNME